MRPLAAVAGCIIPERPVRTVFHAFFFKGRAREQSKRMFALVAMACLVTLSGCATRPGPELLRPVASAPKGSQSVSVFAATDRAMTTENGVTSYGGERGERAYEELTIAVAQPAKISRDTDFSKSNRNLAKDFATLARQQLGQQAFRQKIATQAKADGSTIVVFVHGYNQSYQEALFRMAQMSIDSGLNAVPILFSWPSEANIPGYVADRDGATYARDDLVDLLTMLGRIPSGHNVLVMGHSMGAWLVMESLRQLRGKEIAT